MDKLLKITRKNASRINTLIVGVICLTLAGFFAILYSIYPPGGGVLETGDPRPLTFFGKILVEEENSIRDKLAQNGRKASVDSRLLYLGIDSDSIELDQLWPEEIEASPALKEMSQGWPWNRSVYAHILDKLFSAGTKVVIVDLLFPRPANGDAELQSALDRHKEKVVLGCNFEILHSAQGWTQTPLSMPHDGLVPQTIPIDARLAFVNFFPDSDGVIREAHYARPFHDGFIPSIAARTMMKLDMEERVPSEPKIFRFAGTAGTYPSISVWQIFSEAFWKQNLEDGKIFKDKIVILGPKGNFQHDSHPTPLGLMPGPELHLHALGATLNGAFLYELPISLNFLIMLMAGFGAWVLSLIIRHPIAHFIVVVGVVLAYLALLQFLFDEYSLFVAGFTPIVIFAGGSLTCLIFQFIRERVERGRVQSTLEKYVSQNVVRELLNNSEAYEHALGGMRKPVTVLFSDIRGFTTMTESADSQALVTQLNEYLTEMVECVFNHQGTLDKFIGDAVMAVWGNAVSHGSQTDAVMAVRSALEMRRALDKLNQRWKQEGRAELHIGIGLNHGEVIVGNMGSPKRMEFTVIGDAVNLASRLEGLTKNYHVDVLIGETVADWVREVFELRTVALVQVKGKTRPVETFAVLGEKGKADVPADFLSLYEEGIQLYRERKFAEAAERFEKGLSFVPDDFLCELYLKESRYLLDNPPEADWNGVNVMTSK